MGHGGDPPDVQSFDVQEVFNGSGASAFSGVLNGGREAQSHEFLEVEVIGGGSGLHVTTRGSRRVGAGDIFIHRPGTWHGYEDCHELVIANMSLAPWSLRGDSFLLEMMPELRDLLWRRPTSFGHHGIYTTTIPEAEAVDTVRQITALSRSLDEQPHNRPLLTGRVLMILGTLMQHITPDNDTPPLPPVIENILAQFDAAPERDWYVDELAEAAGLSSTYIIHLFKRHLGLPPITYLAHIRAERAARMLARSAQPVAHIGAQVGWPEPAYFTRRFRAFFGLTPTQYRQRSQTFLTGPTQ